MKTVTILGVDYRIGRLNAFAQMYILKRAIPVLGALKGLYDGHDASRPEDVLEPLCAAIGGLPDESLEYVCNAALDVVDVRQPGGGWAPARSGGRLMFPDMSLLTMLSLTAHVISDNLTDFFRALPAFAEAPGATIQTSNG